jgi:hypothetical protein
VVGRCDRARRAGSEGGVDVSWVWTFVWCCLALQGISMVATTVQLPVCRRYGLRLTRVTVGVGPPVGRWFPAAYVVCLRLVPLALRLHWAFPATPGHARRVRVLDVLAVGSLAAQWAFVLLVPHGSVFWTYLVIYVVLTGYLLFWANPMGGGGRLVQRCLGRSVPDPLADPGSARETRARWNRMLLAQGELALVLTNTQEFDADWPRTPEEAYLWSEMTGHGRGNVVDALWLLDERVAPLYARWPERHPTRVIIELWSVQYLLAAAEAGQHPLADALVRARRATGQVTFAAETRNGELRRGVAAFARALEEPGPKAVRAARAALRGDLTRLATADAYCTLALALRADPDPGAARAALERARDLVPWYARIDRTAERLAAEAV